MVDVADLARVSEANPRSVARWRTQETIPRRGAEERLLELRAVVDLTRSVMTEFDPASVARAPAKGLSAVGFRNQAIEFNNPLSGEGACLFGGPLTKQVEPAFQRGERGGWGSVTFD